ncbi:hypothetical protein D8Y22_13265 [Salinadaptatus halalkaliphilus]|uniref:DUF7310 domain-containing protein n=1 Tax=Salinadaptatus halalkaliphilus TaxID=2419781 RepID=A0A4S3TMT7_9EURY|nr:hypothetical protein [Salinadaptatus halalkaliphilus]THE64375.1 hypothetical protein D8Y22_13265 [Salinadaptatus halalkaliphilus]
MTDIDRLEQRLSAVERVVVDGDVTVDELSELTAMADVVEQLETRLHEHEQRLADLEAAVQSLEGYVGNVESINDDVARQAATATATTDRLERRLDRLEVELDDLEGGLLESDDRGHAIEAAESNESEVNESQDKTQSGKCDTVRTDDSDSLDDTEHPQADERTATSFEFGTTETDGSGGNRELEPEQTVAELFEDDEKSKPTVDDGVDRPASSANQSAVESAVGPEPSRSGTGDTDTNTGGDARGLLGSIRSRLS